MRPCAQGALTSHPRAAAGPAPSHRHPRPCTHRDAEPGEAALPEPPGQGGAGPECQVRWPGSHVQPVLGAEEARSHSED